MFRVDKPLINWDAFIQRTCRLNLNLLLLNFSPLPVTPLISLGLYKNPIVNFEMPRRPRPAHRVPPGRVRTSKAKIVPVRETKSNHHRVAQDEESFSEEFKEGFRGEGKPGTRNALKRKREEEDDDDDDDDDEYEELDADTDIDVDVDADTPRVVQWVDDEDILPSRSWAQDEITQKVLDEVRLYLHALLTMSLRLLNLRKRWKLVRL